MRLILFAVLAVALSGCGIIQAQKNEEARRLRMEQERERQEAIAQEYARRRENAKKLTEGMSPAAVAELIGEPGMSEMKSGKLIRKYNAGGIPMNLTYSKEKLVGWEIDQVVVDRMRQEEMADAEREEQARQQALNREQQRKAAILQYMGTTKPRTCQQYMVGGVLQTQCH